MASKDKRELEMEVYHRSMAKMLQSKQVKDRERLSISSQ
jgi:hypothetical protein